MKALRGQNAGMTGWLSVVAKPICSIFGVLLLFSGVAAASPSITGFLVNGVASTTGPVGASLTIQGSGFGATQGFSTATLNGTPVAGNGVKPTSWSDTSIVVTIPTTATSGPVIVKVSGVSSNAMNFSIGALISSISATTAPVGSTISITGAGFGTAGGTVTFGGAAATTTSWTATSIQAQVPSAATTGSIIVSVGGQASNGVAFTPTPVITGVSPASSVSGTTVTITGTGFGSVAGSVAFNSIEATVKTWGINSITARVPQNGTLGANNVVVTVNSISSSAAGFTIIPTVTVWPTASAITFGQTLASSTLSGGTAAVAGSFAFTTPTTAPPTGTALQSVTFTPTDTTDFYAVTSTISVTVNKATPSVSAWPTASAITFGQTLASSTLTGGTASVLGSFAFTTPTTAPTAGTAAQSVTFTPTDTTDYNAVTSTVNVTVNRGTPTVSAWPTASAIGFGQTLASSTLSGGAASVAGSFAFTTPSTAPPLGTAAQSVTFTPTDATNYNTVTGTINVTVNKGTPTITVLPTASAITFGQTLASSTLTGGAASVAGSFAFTTPSTAPTAGTAGQSVTFTPTDTTDYNTVTGTVNVTVNQATPTVSAWPTASNITLGQTLASSTLSGGTASVAGSFAFTTPGTAPPVGTVLQSVTFTPTDTTDYTTVTGTVNVTVLAQPTITGLSLSEGPPQMGTIVKGTNFGDGTGASGVTIGGLPATVLNNSWTATSITVQVPNAAVEPAQVVVTNSTGGSSTGFTFKVDAPFPCNLP